MESSAMAAAAVGGICAAAPRILFIVIPSEARNPPFADSLGYFVSKKQLGRLLVWPACAGRLRMNSPAKRFTPVSCCW
jgi:hypothetical protein